MRVAFVVADPRAQRAEHTTPYLAQAAARRGHDVGFVGVDDLTLAAGDRVTAQVLRPAAPCADNEALCAALAAEDARVSDEPLADWDVVFLRYHPIQDGALAAHPAANFGARLQTAGVLVVNDPEGTQRAGARMYLSGLPREIRPRTLISRDPARVKAFLRRLDAPAVVKPLAENDDTIFYVARGQVKNLNQIISVVKKRGYVVAQEYLHEVSQGEKRLLLLGGEPIRVGGRVAVYKRFVPQRETGGPIERRACDFAPSDARIVELVRDRLRGDGLYFVGIDVVGDKVLEVNVYTPGGAHANRELYGIDVGDAVIADLERRVAARAPRPAAAVA